MSVAARLIPPAPPPPLPPRPWTAARVTGSIVLGMMAALAVLLVIYLVNAWNPDLFDRYGPNYLSGLGITLGLVGLSVTIGAVISVPVALARMTENRVAGALAYAYVYFFRGTPLLAQVFLVYYGMGEFRAELDAVGLWSFFRDAWNCAVFAFALNTAAYQAEILRGAIQSVPKGQWEAASALGIGRATAFRRIILPQALIVALRPYGNEIVLMLKGSAIVAIITVLDLMGETRRAFSRSFDFQTYIWAAVIYLLMVETLRIIWGRLEHRLTRHLKREG